jgi:beta-phosphoglucomutase-like phosphatase (HAD superfamily)
MAPRGVTLSDESYYERYLGYDDAGVFKALGRDFGLRMEDGHVDTLIREKGRRYDALVAAGQIVFPGAADFIRAAAAAVPIAIASGAFRHEIEDVLQRAGLRHLFPVIVGADQTERSKPNPDPYLAAFAGLCAHAGRQLEPWRSVAIEDSKWGLMSAKGADLRLVGVATTYSPAELKPHAELVFTGLQAITLDVLDTLCAD